jgi:hypothetical protein
VKYPLSPTPVGWIVPPVEVEFDTPVCEYVIVVPAMVAIGYVPVKVESDVDAIVILLPGISAAAPSGTADIVRVETHDGHPVLAALVIAYVVG